jgi:hypothetical protein
VFVIALCGHYWVYPILAVLSSSARALFIAVLTVVMALFYALGKWLHDVIWPAQGLEPTDTSDVRMKPVQVIVEVDQTSLKSATSKY